MFAFIDWTFKKYFMLVVDAFFMRLTDIIGTEDKKLIIAVSELMVIVIGAMTAGKSWEG